MTDDELTPPKEHRVELRLDWPPVRVHKEPMTAGSHLWMSIVAVSVTAMLLYYEINVFAAVMAAVAGYATNNYLVHNDLYDLETKDGDSDE